VRSRPVPGEPLSCEWWRHRTVVSVGGVLAALGDLVEDIVVRVGGPINIASDTEATIVRRRGGSAANVAAAAARIAGSARFLGQVGDDPAGDAMLVALRSDGVETGAVRRGGRTGTIVVLVDDRGERTMLTDTGSSRSLDRPDPAWLDDVDVVHVPLYSLVSEPIASTARTVIGWALDRAIGVSIDLSSLAVLEAVGRADVAAMLELLRPSAVFANADEAAWLGIAAPVAGATTFVKHGAEPAVVFTAGGAITVPAIAVADVADTTGAGDAFAAGVLSHPGWRHDARTACERGHRSAASLFAGR
jgi:sugar/nucleoside kinase (ribokinase family)